MLNSILAKLEEPLKRRRMVLIKRRRASKDPKSKD